MAEAELPLVTVVTPTWQRHDLITRNVESVMAQTYSRVQHIVVSDGPDDELVRKLAPLTGKWESSGYELIVKTLPEHDNTVKWGMRARQHGIDTAGGSLIAYLDDDNLYHPTHIERLANLLSKDSEAGFAYSRFMYYDFFVVTAQYFNTPSIHGSNPPMFCHIDTSCIMHRKEILDIEGCNWRAHHFTIDWSLVERWMAAGIKWAYDVEVTVDYFKDARRYHEYKEAQ
jgi:glycosyltransferase involved in cell wall biosynthesis